MLQKEEVRRAFKRVDNSNQGLIHTFDDFELLLLVLGVKATPMVMHVTYRLSHNILCYIIPYTTPPLSLLDVINKTTSWSNRDIIKLTIIQEFRKIYQDCYDVYGSVLVFDVFYEWWTDYVGSLHKWQLEYLNCNVTYECTSFIWIKVIVTLLF